MSNINEKVLKNAQYRKGLSIAFFNSTNSAISLVKNIVDQGTDMDKVLEMVFDIRDKMLEEHKTYYAEVIANVGKNYDAKESIKRLEETKTLEELNAVWLSFSQDERQDGDIRKVASELKKKYNEKT